MSTLSKWSQDWLDAVRARKVFTQLRYYDHGDLLPLQREIGHSETGVKQSQPETSFPFPKKVLEDGWQALFGSF